MKRFVLDFWKPGFYQRNYSIHFTIGNLSSKRILLAKKQNKTKPKVILTFFILEGPKTFDSLQTNTHTTALGALQTCIYQELKNYQGK